MPLNEAGFQCPGIRKTHNHSRFDMHCNELYADWTKNVENTTFIYART